MGAKQSKKAFKRTLTCQALIDKCRNSTTVDDSCTNLVLDSPVAQEACNPDIFPLATPGSFQRCYFNSSSSPYSMTLAENACMQTFMSNSPALQKLALAYVSKNDLAAAIGPDNLQLLKQGRTDWIPNWIEVNRNFKTEGGLDLTGVQLYEPSKVGTPTTSRIDKTVSWGNVLTEGEEEKPVKLSGGKRKTRKHKKRKSRRTRRKYRKSHKKHT